MPKHLFKILLVSFLLFGCAVKVEPPKNAQITLLTEMLKTLDFSIEKNEAQHLSKDIFSKTNALTKEYKFTSPPQYHNFLVNVGLREKGLCFHWSDALYTYLNVQEHTAFEFHLMGTHIGEYWSEHNVLVVIARGKSVEEGIIIDPWRNPGELYFSRVKDDTKYKWRHRSDRGCKR